MSSRISKILTTLLIVGAIVLACGAIGAILRDRSGSVADGAFAVTYSETEYTQTDEPSVITLSDSGSAVFGIKGTASYTVSIAANAEFDYTVNGKVYAFSSEELTPVILTSEDIYPDRFEIDCERATVHGALRRIWGSKARIDFPADKAILPYIMTVVSAGGSTVKLVLDCPIGAPSDDASGEIELIPGDIVF